MTGKELAPARDLVDEVLFGDARGGRAPEVKVEIEVVRALDGEDVPQILEGIPVGQHPGTIKILTLRAAHHRLAELLAQGMPSERAALITGYSPSHVAQLKGDPSFRELLAHYTAFREAHFVDVLDRMKDLGLDALAELRKRLEDAPDEWSKQQLMDLAELTLGKAAGRGLPGPGSGGQVQAPGSGVSVHVSFVQAPTSGSVPSPPPGSGPLIDHE